MTIFKLVYFSGMVFDLIVFSMLLQTLISSRFWINNTQIKTDGKTKIPSDQMTAPSWSREPETGRRDPGSLE